ncbi:MAG: ISAs1 family transposase, partial [Rubinisphaera sp.]|nr:ISAs1 family transposase [Rubinisphaera sp.]
GYAPQVLAAVRNSAINWLRSRKVTQFAAELRRNSWNSQRLFAILGKPNL